MVVMGLGVECLDFDIRLAFLDVAGGTRLDRLAGFDDAGLINGLVVLNDAESLGGTCCPGRFAR